MQLHSTNIQVKHLFPLTPDKKKKKRKKCPILFREQVQLFWCPVLSVDAMHYRDTRKV